MKNILLLILLGLYAYATSETFELLEERKEQNMEKFRKEAKDYYKAWAIGYCLGHYKIEDNVKFNYEKPVTKVKGTDFIADSKIDKMVYYGGIEPLKEIEALVVKFKMSRYFFNEDSDCLEILFREWVQEKIENIIKKYHIDELSPREMAERVPRKDKIK